MWSRSTPSRVSPASLPKPVCSTGRRKSARCTRCGPTLIPSVSRAFSATRSSRRHAGRIMMPPETSRSAMTRRVLASDPNLAYHLYVPKKLSAEPRLVVSIHGASRNIDVHARLLSAYADIYGAVLLVPHFSEARYRDYQRLGRTGRGRRADLALHRLVAEAVPETGTPVDRFYLFGFSAGAQFAHRYAMAYPHRVAYAVIANSGRYTLPDPEQKFPRGIRSTRKLPGLRFDLEAFLRVPIKVYVGKEIEAITLPRRRRTNGDEDVPRAERGRRWVAAM